jgi:hypothetical protein
MFENTCGVKKDNLSNKITSRWPSGKIVACSKRGFLKGLKSGVRKKTQEGAKMRLLLYATF